MRSFKFAKNCVPPSEHLVFAAQCRALKPQLLPFLDPLEIKHDNGTSSHVVPSYCPHSALLSAKTCKAMASQRRSPRLRDLARTRTWSDSEMGQGYVDGFLLIYYTKLTDSIHKNMCYQCYLLYNLYNIIYVYCIIPTYYILFHVCMYHYWTTYYIQYIQ